MVVLSLNDLLEPGFFYFFIFFAVTFLSCEVMKGLHDVACGESELCSPLSFPVSSATSSILICVVLWTQAERVIPSSITVSVTRVLMVGPVRIGWMDITVIVRLVSNGRKTLWGFSQRWSIEKQDGQFHARVSHAIINLWYLKQMWPVNSVCVSIFHALLSSVRPQFVGKKYDLTAAISALFLLNTEHIISLDRDSVFICRYIYHSSTVNHSLASSLTPLLVCFHPQGFSANTVSWTATALRSSPTWSFLPWIPTITTYISSLLPWRAMHYSCTTTITRLETRRSSWLWRSSRVECASPSTWEVELINWWLWLKSQTGSFTQSSPGEPAWWESLLLLWFKIAPNVNLFFIVHSWKSYHLVV